MDDISSEARLLAIEYLLIRVLRQIYEIQQVPDDQVRTRMKEFLDSISFHAFNDAELDPVQSDHKAAEVQRFLRGYLIAAASPGNDGLFPTAPEA